ncbi:VIER F-box protein 2 [Tanacetum coccineum]
MHSRFEMSLIGEMKFFLGLQIHQSPKGIFINQAKYALEILKKHNMDNCHSIGTPLATKPKLDVDLSGEPVDQSDYRSKSSPALYLTSSRPELSASKKHFLGDTVPCVKLVSWMSRNRIALLILQQRQCSDALDGTRACLTGPDSLNMTQLSKNVVDNSYVIGSSEEVTIYGASLSSTMIEDGEEVSPTSRVFAAELFDTSEELRENTFSGSDNEDANEHIKKVLEIFDLFHVPNIIVDQSGSESAFLYILMEPQVIVRMTKVIKGEFEKIMDVKVEDVSLTCDTPLEVFKNDVSRLCRMDDDSEHEADDDMGYDPSDVAFTEWLGSKIFNYKTMDHIIMKSLWIYWIGGDDEAELTDEESSDNEDEVAETYEDYTNDWIYEWNKDVPWVDDKPWTNVGLWTKPIPVKHICKPFNNKTGCLERPTCSCMDDGYCNGGNLPGTYVIRNQLYYQDYEWYQALEESELKDDALETKLS